jgi:microsomal dipeptidase-like Zn-dependent dipeptidase
MLADLHAHYPMHVIRGVEPDTTLNRMRSVQGRPRLLDKARAAVLNVLSRLLSDEDWETGARVTTPYLAAGGVKLVFSVLYRPFEEMDLSRPYMAPPASEYFAALLRDLDAVERHVAKIDPDVIRIVHDRAELDQCITDGAIALVHCVEGGFHLGDTPDEIAGNVAVLAGRGVAYITIAHLFFRQVAANAPALHFLPDAVYNTLFPQRRNVGLTERGEAAIQAAVKHKVIVDLAHMRSDAVKETLDLLDRLDPERRIPVISSHAGYRFGKQQYMHDADTVRAIGRRNGVIGLIMAQHQLNDGVRKSTRTFAESLEVIRCHVDKIVELTGSFDHVTLGTDLDGFIKPTLGGLQDMRDMKELERGLDRLYGTNSSAICHENALRLIRAVW